MLQQLLEHLYNRKSITKLYMSTTTADLILACDHTVIDAKYAIDIPVDLVQWIPLNCVACLDVHRTLDLITLEVNNA